MAFALLAASLTAQKPPLDHSVYDGWKSISSASISDDGNWITFEILPQQGDGRLYIIDSKSGNKDSIPYGTGAKISPDSRYIAYFLKPSYAAAREARKKKLKEDQMPVNDLVIRMLPDGKPIKADRVKSFEVPREGSDWMAYLQEKDAGSAKEDKAFPDTLKTVSGKPGKTDKKPESKGTGLVILNPVTGKEYKYSDVVEYAVSRDGRSIGFVQDFPDTAKNNNFMVWLFNTRKEAFIKIFEGKGTLKKLTSDRTGDKFSFIYTSDTARNKIYDLYLSESYSGAVKIVGWENSSMPSGWSVSENGKLFFSDDGSRLFFGTAEKPVKEPDDTLLEDEKYRLDIWSWDDDYLQPMQKKELENEKKRSYMAVYHADRHTMVQLASKDLPEVKTVLKGNGNFALGSSDLKYRKLVSWDKEYNDYYIINVETGTNNLSLEKASSIVQMAPSSRFVVWWNPEEKAWFSCNLSSGTEKNISSGINYPLYDEKWDMPTDPEPYGIEGWLDDEKHILIRDRYDIWMVDLSGLEPPVNLTNGFGRLNNTTFTYHRLDPEKEFIERKGKIYFSSFNDLNKESGYYVLRQAVKSDPLLLYSGKVSFPVPIKKAGKADRMIWAKGSFEVCPELYVSNMDFSEARKLSVTNPQQKNYNWGTVELVEWNSFDNTKLQGLMYRPEDFDPSKKYPMIVYFYEKSSQDLYSYLPPAPARSILNRVFAASNGYLVFVTDIPYETGFPGKSCYNAVMSGTYAMLDRYPYIDRNRLALDGQSWGGYQIAYLVTQTDLFACAYSGAPVVNMVSAYGGIRWESGMSRMFQYENTQSRIGGTLWEKPFHYIENSPIFNVPRIKTPLLVMHNDADGAVPWYQGIEFITALRRLGKTAWLLSYNDEAHNLLKRPNMKDLAVRKMQFYDYYLKNAPMPYWMKYGISQLEKGKKDGYEPVKD